MILYPVHQKPYLLTCTYLKPFLHRQRTRALDLLPQPGRYASADRPAHQARGPAVQRRDPLRGHLGVAQGHRGQRLFAAPDVEVTAVW